MQILEDEHIVEPGQTFMFIRIHMFTVEEEQLDLIHDLPEALGFANTTGIQTDVVAPAYGRVEQPQQKRSRRCGLAAAKGHAAVRRLKVQIVDGQRVIQRFRGLEPCGGRAVAGFGVETPAAVQRTAAYTDQRHHAAAVMIDAMAAQRVYGQKRAHG